MNARIDKTSEVIAAPHEHLGGKLGVLRVASMVIAFSAPLAVVSGFLAVVMAFGNGLGAPMAFLSIGLILLCFSVGFTELVKALPWSGGFYVYITAGLGRPLGLGGTLIALLSYFLIAAGTYAFFGLVTSRFVSEQLGGPVIPWWVYTAGGWLVSAFLSYREISLSARVLGISIILEFALMLGFDASVLIGNGHEAFSTVPFSAAAMFSGTPGLALLFSAGMFLGFESTAIYRDEAREPERTIPKATFLTVIFMTIFYAGTTYLLITSLGTSRAVSIATADPSKTFPFALQNELGGGATLMGYLLLCVSVYGAVLSMHNVLSRYVFRMATNGLLPTRLGRIHGKYNAPSTAALTTALILVVFVVPFVVVDIAPDLLYARLVGVGAFGLIMLLFLTSIAVIVYFRRTQNGLGQFRSVVFPSLASLGLLAVFVLANRNFVGLVGTSETASDAILMMIYSIIIAGVLWGLWLRTKRPDIYSGIGQD